VWPVLQCGFTHVGSNIILKSTDGGVNWSKVYGGTDSLVYDFVLSSDLGLTEIKDHDYKQQPVFTAVYIDDKHNRILVAGGFYKNSGSSFNHFILSSSDSGETWNELLLASSPDTIKRSDYPPLYIPGIINDITVDDKGTIWAVDNGLLLSSTDSGIHWNYYLFPNSGKAYYPSLPDNQDVTCLPTSIGLIGNNGWIAAGLENNSVPPGGISGIYYGSIDAGVSWATEAFIVNDDIGPHFIGSLLHNKLIVNENGNGYIGWMIGGVMLSSPGEIEYSLMQLKKYGEKEFKWEAFEFPEDETNNHFFIDIDMNSMGIGCCVCPNGEFYLTGNWGNEWGEKHNIDNGNKFVFYYTVALSDNELGVFTGDDGHVAVIDNFVSVRNQPVQKHLTMANKIKMNNFQLNGRVVRYDNIPSQCIIMKSDNLIYQKRLSSFR